MEKHSTRQAAGAQKIETLGGAYVLRWDGKTQMIVNAHAALLNQFAKAGGFFDRLLETCPMRLPSNNAPEVRDLIATVKPLYGCQEGAEFDYSPQKPGRPSHRYRTLCIAKLRLTLAVVVHPGSETSCPSTTSAATHLRRDEEPVGMERLPGALAKTDGALRGDGRDRGEHVERVHASWRRRDAPRGRAATSRPLLQSCAARLSCHTRQGIVAIYTATNEKDREIYRAISAFLSRISSASQLGLEERRQRIIAHAFREYGTVQRMFPPDIGGQMTMPFT